MGPLRASGPRGQALVLEGHRVTQRALPLLSALDGVPGVATPPSPPPPRNMWTRRVPHPVLIGHAASLTLSDLGGPARLLDSP